MLYQINEGSFNFLTGVDDDSVNILKFTERQASLVVTRAELKNGQTEEDYFSKQVGELKKSMKRFLIGDRKPATLGSDKPLEATEAQLQFEQKGTKLHQFLLIARLPESRLLVITYAQARPFAPEDTEHWQSIKASFVPVTDN